MQYPSRVVGGLMLLALLTVSAPRAAVADETANSTKADPSDTVFGQTRIWKIHVRVTAENWKKMQPAGGFPFGPRPGGGPPRNPAENRKGPNSNERAQEGRPPMPPGRPGGGPGGFRPGSFGFEFEYVSADVELDDEQLKNVGLRFKGNGTYGMSAGARKRPLKIDFNRFVDKQKFHGLQQLNLHNNVMDPTHVRQALSYPVFQAAGVPSPRTAFAEVSLTIDGECDHEPLGIYTVVEEIDKDFLKRHFQTEKGMLLKPEGVPGLQYMGEDWANYAWYDPKTKTKPHEQQRLIEFTRLIHQADDQQFRREVASMLDTDEFASFLAANVLLTNMDSFLTNVHNYYLYLNPKTKKFEFLPWDLDLAMGAFFPAGSAEQLQDLSISHPHVGQNRLIERMLEWDEFDRVYRQRLRELIEKCFGKEGITTKTLPEVRAAVKDAAAREKERADAAAAKRPQGGFGFPSGMGNPFNNQPPLETFIAKRQESINAQLAGKSKGRAPTMMGFGPPPGGGPRGPGGGGPGFGPGNMLAPRLSNIADGDQNQKVGKQEFLDLGARWLKKWDQDKNDSLSVTEITDGLNEAFGPPPDAPPDAPKPPKGFGPGNFLGRPMLMFSDKDQSGETSAEEWQTLFGDWFKQWDKNKDDSLVVEELTAGMNTVFAPPPGFGRPGGPPQQTPKKPTD